MKVLGELLYSKTHEWVLVKDDVAYIGISDYAQDALGDIVYFEPVEVGDGLMKNQVAGTIESVKAAEDLLAPLSGVVLEVNNEVYMNPELLNEDCYANWIYKIKIQNEEEIDALLTASEYEEVLLDV